MSTESKTEGKDPQEDADQALWELLGRARPVEVSPYFARRVLRDLEVEDARPAAAGRWRAWFRPAWVFAGGTAVLAVGVSVFAFSSMRLVPRPAILPRQTESPVFAVAPRSSVPPVASGAGEPTSGKDLAAEVSPQDIDVIADLDSLVAREETNVWIDDTSRF